MAGVVGSEPTWEDQDPCLAAFKMVSLSVLNWSDGISKRE
jgi:hypothetical protein